MVESFFCKIEPFSCIYKKKVLPLQTKYLIGYVINIIINYKLISYYDSHNIQQTERSEG